MTISTKGRYALRVMVDLATNDNGLAIPLHEVARRQNLSIKYLEQIMTPLNRAGYLISTRGASGGYRLARPAADYKVGDILRTMEGNLDPVDMKELVAGRDAPYYYATLDFWRGFSKAVNEYVDRFTLEDLVNAQKNLFGNDYSI
ncbi:MAG: Rrf2 family transcriptional regulator [Oscillospiraceae bacterium]|nr:Rrf2 family transcriptional regulator [Oscillospiraceae bacterium]